MKIWRAGRLAAFAAGGILAMGASARSAGISGHDAQEGEKAAFGALFVKTDVMIPMRDGVKLHTEIYAPRNASEKLPLFLTRTPYGLGDDDAGYSRLL